MNTLRVCVLVMLVPLVSVPALGAPAAAPGIRVFIAPLRVGAGADKDVVSLFEERILAAAKRQTGFTVIGGADVRAVADVEAARQASGCESDESCAAEIAGALDAPEIVTGQLGRVGNTWVLALSRTERGTMTVLARVVRERQGETPEGLLGDIDGVVAEVFAPSGPGLSGLTVAGGVVAGVGAVALITGTVAAVLSWTSFADATRQLESSEVPAEEKIVLRNKAIKDGDLTNTIALIGWTAGGVFAVAGVAGVALGLGADVAGAE